ncbi:MAG: hypothetical protein GX466_08320 [Candidatus Cloacimonetes bacterium]|nr:hypothetical protein [Candidatus Cloacimonadota bacterium]
MIYCEDCSSYECGCPERKEIESLHRQLDAKQAEVDALMLEYCPSEMSQEQLDTWAAHQRPSEWKTNDELRQQLAELLDWQQKAFAACPNIDMDIDRMKGGN